MLRTLISETRWTRAVKLATGYSLDGELSVELNFVENGFSERIISWEPPFSFQHFDHGAMHGHDGDLPSRYANRYWLAGKDLS